MRHRSFIGLLLLALAAAPAIPAGARVSDEDLRRATTSLETARREAGETAALLAAARAEEERLQARLERLAGEVAAAESRYAAARREARLRARDLYVAAGEGPVAGGPADGSAVLRRAYAAALAQREREVVNSLQAAAADRERLRLALREQAGEQTALGRRLEALTEGAGRTLLEAEAEYARVRAAWEAQEAARRAAAAAASAASTTTAPVEPPGTATTAGTTTTTTPESPATTTTTTTTTTAPPSPTTSAAPTTTLPPPVQGGAFPPLVERWRPLVTVYFAASLVDEALSIIRCESWGDPAVVNPVSGAAGLFQHMPRYWPDRAAAAGFRGASPFDAEANIAAAAWLVQVSVESGLTPWYFWSCRP